MEFKIAEIRLVPEPHWVNSVLYFANEVVPDEFTLDEWKSFVDDRFGHLSGAAMWPELLAYPNDSIEAQHHLHRLLESLIRSEGVPTGSVNRQLSECVDELEIWFEVRFTKTGKRQADQMGIKILKIEQWFASALMALIEANLAHRLRRCAFKSCNKYFMDWPRRRGAPRQKYCCPNHSNAARQAKVRRNRNAQQLEARHL